MESHYIVDPIYNFSKTIVIDEIAYQIIKTPEFQRLLGIKQAGITGLFTKRSYNRFEHSIGVYLLLKHLKLPTEKCIGGLLHDIYHTNFSHTTDELFCGESNNSFHEQNKFKFFEKCCQNIINILTINFPQYKYTDFLVGELMAITKNKSFGADMVDYFLRDGFYEGVFDENWINAIIEKLYVSKDTIILNDITLSKEFFIKTIYINDNVYMAPFSRGQYKIFVHVLDLALKSSLIDTELLIYGNSSDAEIYQLIKSGEDQQIKDLIQLLETTTEFSYDARSGTNWKKINAKITRKLRYLNPTCRIIKEPMKISDEQLELEEIRLMSEIDDQLGDLLDSKIKQYSQQEDLFMATELNTCDL